MFDGVIPNPTNEVGKRGALLAQKERDRRLRGSGRGSSIDLTKAVNILMTNPGPIGQYGGIGLVKNQVLPLIAIPTTAGTSSEITNVVALTDTKAVCKYVIIDNKIVHDKVIADPEFTKTMPPSVTAGHRNGCHYPCGRKLYFQYGNASDRVPFSKRTADFYEYLPRAVKNGADMEAKRADDAGMHHCRIRVL